MRRGLASLLAGLAGLGWLVLPGAAPASAAGCPGTGGVEVIIEYGALGRGDAVDCAATGGRTAAEIVASTGHRQEQVQRYPGAVCRVDGLPASASCVDMPPTNAYWALFWSNGSGSWVYAQQGAYSQQVPSGGKVAWVWQGSNARNTPNHSSRRTAPPPPPPASKPSSKHSSKPSSPAPSATGGSGDRGAAAASGSRGGGTGGSDGGAGAASPPAAAGATPPAAGATSPPAGAGAVGAPAGPPATGPSAGPGQRRPRQGLQALRPGATSDPVEPTRAGADTATTGEVASNGPGATGLPVWVIVLVLAGLLGAAGVTALLRSRSA